MAFTHLLNNAKSMIAASVVAAALALGCSSMAFADTFQVHVETDGTTIDQTVDLQYAENADPVYGQFYKSDVWNVLATTNYVTLDDAIQSALDAYKAQTGTALTAEDLIADHDVRFITSDFPNVSNPYNKYAATYADVYETTDFFGGVTNSITAFNESYLTHTSNVGAVLAKSYGTAKTSTTAEAAAEQAKNSQVTQDLPRLITGCSADMTSDTAMGKRYVYDVLGVVIK